jgi:hypothetical protein
MLPVAEPPSGSPPMHRASSSGSTPFLAPVGGSDFYGGGALAAPVPIDAGDSSGSPHHDDHHHHHHPHHQTLHAHPTDQGGDTRRNVYVRNLAPSVTSEQLRQLFEPYGEVESHKLMVDIRTGTSRGFGFVMFTMPRSAAQSVAALDAQMFMGRELSVRLADDKTRQPGEPTTRVFIRNLPPAFTTEQLNRLCAYSGTVVSCMLRRDDRHGQQTFDGRGVTCTAHVEMADVASARRLADTLNNSNMFLHSVPVPLQAKVVDSLRRGGPLTDEPPSSSHSSHFGHYAGPQQSQHFQHPAASAAHRGAGIPSTGMAVLSSPPLAMPPAYGTAPSLHHARPQQLPPYAPFAPAQGVGGAPPAFGGYGYSTAPPPPPYSTGAPQPYLAPPLQPRPTLAPYQPAAMYMPVPQPQQAAPTADASPYAMYVAPDGAGIPSGPGVYATPPTGSYVWYAPMNTLG